MKKGRFTLPRSFVLDQDIVVKRIMSQCIIVRAQMIYVSDVIEYQAISWRFRDVPDHEIMPTYVWTYDTETGELIVEERGYE